MYVLCLWQNAYPGGKMFLRQRRNISNSSYMCEETGLTKLDIVSHHATERRNRTRTVLQDA